MANNFQRPIIAQGNDFYINIILTHLNEGDVENLDLTKCKSVEVYLVCSVHNTRIDLDFTIPQTEYNNVIKAFVDHRMLHNTSYGICVEGTYEDDLHWRWYVQPREGILIIPNTSGQNIPVEIEYIDVAGRVGFGEVDLSDYYTKEETNTILESYATETELQNYQETLVSGENIKTINNQSILGEGNITIETPEQQQANWNESDTVAPSYIQNKPTALSDFQNDMGFITDGEINSSFPETWDLNSTLADLIDDINNDTTATSGKSYFGTVNLTDLPDGLQQAEMQVEIMSEIEGLGKVILLTLTSENTSPYHWEYTSAYGEPSTWKSYVLDTQLATVATTGDYNDLSNTPTIPAAQVQSDWNTTTTTAKSYIKNKPDLSNFATQSDLQNYQETLVSGTNIKTINNQSLLGSGNITIQGGGGTQVQSNWNETDTSSAAYIQNKPTALSSFQNDTNFITQNDVITYEPIPAGWDITHTLSDLITDIQADATATEGKSYLGTVQLTDLPASMTQAELQIDIVDVTSGQGDIINFTLKSASHAPYHWEVTSVYGSWGTWKGFVVQSQLATVATTGDYNDLINKPTTQTPGFQQYTYNNKTGLVNTLTTYYDPYIGTQAVIEGEGTTSTNISAQGDNAHAEGYQTNAGGKYAHAEGDTTTASQRGAHAEGRQSSATNWCAHAEGRSTTASGDGSHSEGYYTTAQNTGEHAEGYFNASSKANNSFGNAGNTLSSIGNGESALARHNAFEVRQNGDIYYADTAQIDNSTYFYSNCPTRKLQDAMVTSTTAGVKIEVVNALPASYDSNTLYIVI